MLIDKNTKYTKFVKCPMSLLTADIPSTAKVVYLMLLNRLSFAISKEQCDRYGNPYLVYSVAEIAHDLKISKSWVVNNMNELEKLDLIQRYHTGKGRAQRIYLNNPDDILSQDDSSDDVFEFSTTGHNSCTDNTEPVYRTGHNSSTDYLTKVTTTDHNSLTDYTTIVEPIYTTDTTNNTTSLYTTDNTILTYPEKEREKTVENVSVNHAKETDDWNTELEAIRARVRMINEKYNTRYKHE